MKIAVYGRVIRPAVAPYIQELFDLMHQREHQIIICEPYLAEIRSKINIKSEFEILKQGESLEGKADYVFSLGGDGTILDTATLVRDTGIPIMGVNIGRLGFLSSIGKEKIEAALDALENNTYTRDSRSLIHLDSKPGVFGELPFALNEFTIHKRDSSSMITIHVYINGEFMNSYWADGLIVATPTGSTGYSLSCGGPIIFPQSGSLVITPVAPHNLNIRPIVVNDDAVISFEVEGRAKSFLVTLDSRYASITAEHQLAVRKENFTVNLVRMDEINFLGTLRSKLNLGLDSRN
jgi:NAD+ kinase